MMRRAEIFDVTESILKKAGFQLSERCVSRECCFDFAARKGNNLVLIKVPPDIGCVSMRNALELQRISVCFSATPLFIGDKTREKRLEDDTIYNRYSIRAITPETFRSLVVRKLYPLVEAGPGGYYVNLDGDEIKERREMIGLSIGKLAEMLGVSRRTLYGYEKGMAKASVSTALNLEWILGTPVVRPINVLERRVGGTSASFLAAARLMVSRHSFLRVVVKKLSRFNFTIAPTRRAPFDFIALCHEEGRHIVGGVANKKERDVNQRTKEIVSVSEIVNAQPIFITDGEHIPNSDIPCIHHKDLERMQRLGDLIHGS